MSACPDAALNPTLNFSSGSARSAIALFAALSTARRPDPAMSGSMPTPQNDSVAPRVSLTSPLFHTSSTNDAALALASWLIVCSEYSRRQRSTWRCVRSASRSADSGPFPSPRITRSCPSTKIVPSNCRRSSTASPSEPPGADSAEILNDRRARRPSYADPPIW